MLKSLDLADLAEVLEFARKRSGLTAPAARVLEPASLDERLWWQSTARIRARIAVLTIEAQRELLALAWLGRDRAVLQWEELLARAADTPEPATHIAAKASLDRYLLEGRRLVVETMAAET